MHISTLKSCAIHVRPKNRLALDRAEHSFVGWNFRNVKLADKDQCKLYRFCAWTCTDLIFKADNAEQCKHWKNRYAKASFRLSERVKGFYLAQKFEMLLARLRGTSGQNVRVTTHNNYEYIYGVTGGRRNSNCSQQSYGPFKFLSEVNSINSLRKEALVH